MFANKEDRDQTILNVYKECGTIRETSTRLHLNERTIRRVLVKNGYTDFQSAHKKDKAIVVENGEHTLAFNTITEAARYFEAQDIKKKDRLIHDMRTLKEGLDFKVRLFETHRRYLRHALNTETLYDGEWKVSRL